MKRYNGFFERKRLLENILDGSEKIRETIRCTCSPLHESFMWGGEFFSLASEKIKNGNLPESAVNETADGFGFLTNEDRRIIGRFAKGLNAEDCKGQLSNLDIFIKDIKEAVSNASKELDTKGRLYVKGSILTAAAVVLLLV